MGKASAGDPRNAVVMGPQRRHLLLARGSPAEGRALCIPRHNPRDKGQRRRDPRTWGEQDGAEQQGSSSPQNTLGPAPG